MKSLGESLTIMGGLMQAPAIQIVGWPNVSAGVPGSQNWQAPSVPGQFQPMAIMGGGGPGASSTTQGGPASAPNQTPQRVGAQAYGGGGGGNYGYGAAPAAPALGAAPAGPALGAAPTGPAWGNAPGALMYPLGAPLAGPVGAPPPTPSPLLTTPAINPLHAALQRRAAAAAGDMQAAFTPQDAWAQARAVGYPL